MRPVRAAVAAVLLLVAGPLVAAGRFTVPVPRPGTIITARPSTSTPAVGSLLRVRVDVRGARQVGSVPFTLSYDPAILEFLPSSSAEGTFLRQGGAATSFLAVPGVDRGGGSAVVVGLSRLGGGNGASGSGLLCEMTFRVLSPGTSPLSFLRADALSPAARPLSARFVGSRVQARRAR